MKDKQYDPARNNEQAPEKGMAAVNTFNEGEETISEDNEVKEEEKDTVPKNLPGTDE